MEEARYDFVADESAEPLPEGEAPFCTYLRTLRAGWKTCVLAAFGGLTLGWVITAAMPPRYRASASVEVAGIAEMATQVRIMRSDGLRRAAVGRLIADRPGSPDPTWAAAVSSASEVVEITSAEGSRIIDISSQTATPEAAAGMVNALAEQFVASEREGRLRRIAATRQWMEGQLGELAARIQRSEEADLAQVPSTDGLTQSEIDVARDLYAAFLESLPQIATVVGTVRILDTAQVPSEPLGPQPILGAMAGVFTGLFSGCLFVIVRAKLDRTIKRPGDARRALGLRELGAMPDAAFEKEREHMTPAGFAAQAPIPAEKTCLDDRTSWAAECVRGIRTSLLHGAQSPRVIAVTSPTPSEGKTTVAANLAASLAESGRRTLIVDADLRRPRLHEVFGVSNSQGLADLLVDGYVDPLDFTVAVSRGLWFLPAGVAAFGGPGLIHEAATQGLLERLRCEFDAIVLDAPPALAVSDARTLSSLADGTILVVRAGVTEPDNAIDAKTLLEADGAHLLGVVLNSWNPRIYGPQGYEKYGASYQSSAAA